MSSVFGLVIATALTGAPPASGCLQYGPEVPISGVVLSAVFPEEPGYESVEKGDQAALVPFIVPEIPFCVDAATGDTPDQEEASVSLVQLSCTNTGGLPRGEVIVLRGTLFHTISGHHHAPVILECSKPGFGIPR